MQDLILYIKEFDCFPFDPASPTLRTLQSGIPASTELIRDFTTAKQDGESKLKAFMDERVYSKEKSMIVLSETLIPHLAMSLLAKLLMRTSR